LEIRRVARDDEGERKSKNEKSSVTPVKSTPDVSNSAEQQQPLEEFAKAVETTPVSKATSNQQGKNIIALLRIFGIWTHQARGDDAYPSNLKGTILLEHVIQASDIAHTMQHWHVYIKWNKKLFLEMHLAYISGRTELDPAAGWYKGELWFYDNYIIPLARKLKQCKVFGASSDEFLDYATMNRIEWEAKGEELVEDWLFTSSVSAF
jgi:hypothetical protein